MLTLDERGGEESGVEVRPECGNGLPRSAGTPSAGCPEPVAGVTTLLSLAQGAENPWLRGHESGIQARRRGWAPSIWEMSAYEKTISNIENPDAESVDACCA
jgi:hypothetical protein